MACPRSSSLVLDEMQCLPLSFRADAARCQLLRAHSSPHGLTLLTAPTRIPRTKYCCNMKNTTIGRAIEMNAAAVSSFQFCPNEWTTLLTVAVIGTAAGLPPTYSVHCDRARTRTRM